MSLDPIISQKQMKILYEDQLSLNDAYQRILNPGNGLKKKLVKAASVLRRCSNELNESLNKKSQTTLIESTQAHLLTPYKISSNNTFPTNPATSSDASNSEKSWYCQATDGACYVATGISKMAGTAYVIVKMFKKILEKIKS